MTMLVDHQIAALQATDQPLATEVPADDYQTAGSKIQAASLDLTIGDIYIPGTDNDKLGGANTPLGEITLEQGHTAVIRTKEVLHLGSDLAGIAFPPASVSLKGLLMTNPGHIDPGYHGSLHLTVINMSRVPFSLKKGDRIVRVLFIPLEINQPAAPFDARHPSPELPNPISSELLGRLSVDFVDVKRRAQKIAEDALAAIKIDIEPLPFVTDPLDSLIAGGPDAREEGNVYARSREGSGQPRPRITAVERQLMPNVWLMPNTSVLSSSAALRIVSVL